MKLQKMKQGGFTLLELLVVVAILAIIAGAVISAISGQEERAGQGVALNTMGALENATRQNVVLNGGLPSGLDSLLCADTTGDSSYNQASTNSAELMGASSSGGGLATGYAGELNLVTLPADAADADNDPGTQIAAAGITSLRIAEITACDDTDGNATTVGGNSTFDGSGGDDGLDEVLANRVFWPPEQGGYGFEGTVDGGTNIAVAVLDEPTEVGAEETDIIAVFGVGNFSEMSEGNNKILSRGPVDGNVEGDGQFYSHFSLAIKVGEVSGPAGTSGGDQAAITTSSSFEGDEIEIVAILDSDGDNFDDEIAEFNGLEDE